jgi:hypothetical protein
MNRLLFILFILLFTGFSAQSQPGYLFVKKGYKKKKIYMEGDRILLQISDGSMRAGLITLLRNDSIFINGQAVPRKNVIAVYPPNRSKKKFRVTGKELLLIAGGTALTTAGLTLSKQADFKEAAVAGAVIGFGNLGAQWLLSRSFKRRKYRIGRKFQLQVLDFHLPGSRRAF